jgi:hypothetical protein
MKSKVSSENEIPLAKQITTNIAHSFSWADDIYSGEHETPLLQTHHYKWNHQILRIGASSKTYVSPPPPNL